MKSTLRQLAEPVKSRATGRRATIAASPTEPRYWDCCEAGDTTSLTLRVRELLANLRAVSSGCDPLIGEANDLLNEIADVEAILARRYRQLHDRVVRLAPRAAVTRW